MQQSKICKLLNLRNNVYHGSATTVICVYDEQRYYCWFISRVKHIFMNAHWFFTWKSCKYTNET